MTPKEIRRKILEAAYEYRHDSFGISPERVQDQLPDIDEKTLHQEIAYLGQKNWVELKGKFMGREYLNYLGVAITAWGIDLVEDPEEFGRVFSINVRQNHFGDITGSNVVIDSENVSQIMQNTDDDTKLLLEQLLEAANKKDKSAILKVLGYIGDKSVDLLIAIIAAGVKL